MHNFNDVFRNKTVLITGHTGFKGSWLSIWLNELGANVVGYALDPTNKDDNFILSRIGEKIIDIRGDIRNKSKLEEVFEIYQPEFVFHLAAQPLVRYSYENPVETYEVNVMGTINVLEAIRKSNKTKVGIMVTTDKCYENKEQIWGYRESDPLGGYDPYSSSKGAAEIVINSWRLSFMNPQNNDSLHKAISSVRAGNVIGGGDWSKDRIIPDCIRALENKKKIEIRSPKSIRPWQHVLEPLNGYLMLAEKMYNEPNKYSEAWNFGPDNSSICTVWDLCNLVVECFGYGELKDISGNDGKHEAGILSLDNTKARQKLGWMPILNISNTINYTIDWYKRYSTDDVYILCKNQIIDFSKKI